MVGISARPDPQLKPFSLAMLNPIIWTFQCVLVQLIEERRRHLDFAERLNAAESETKRLQLDYNAVEAQKALLQADLQRATLRAELSKPAPTV